VIFFKNRSLHLIKSRCAEACPGQFNLICLTLSPPFTVFWAIRNLQC